MPRGTHSKLNLFGNHYYTDKFSNQTVQDPQFSQNFTACIGSVMIGVYTIGLLLGILYFVNSQTARYQLLTR